MNVDLGFKVKMEGRIFGTRFNIDFSITLKSISAIIAGMYESLKAHIAGFFSGDWYGEDEATKNKQKGFADMIRNKECVDSGFKTFNHKQHGKEIDDSDDSDFIDDDENA